MATVIESHGPPANRVNYIIVGDGYSATELTTTLITHVNNYMTRRFSEPIGVPYKRYRNFFNICVLQVPSTPICGSSAFRLRQRRTRLANCDDTKVNAAISNTFRPPSRSTSRRSCSTGAAGGTAAAC
jgi:hypothetical protein